MENMDNQGTESQATPDPGQETQVQDWKSSLDESIRSHPSMSNVPDVSTLAKNYVNAQDLIGRKGVPLPTGDDDEKGWDAVYKALGRPEDVKDYANPEIEVAEDLKQFFDESKFESFKEIAHKYGLNKKQFEGIAKDFTQSQLQDIQGILAKDKAAKEEGMQQLMNEWGLDYDNKTKAADKVIDSLTNGVPEEKVALWKTDPHMKKVFASIHDKISEDTLMKGTKSQGITAQEMKAEINRITNDPEYYKPGSFQQENFAKLKGYYEKLEELEKQQ